MRKIKIPNSRKANLDHKKRVERYAALIQQVYDRIAKESVRYADLSGARADIAFSFEDYPLARAAINSLLRELMSDVQAIIMSGTSEEWKESNLVQDLVARKVLTAYTGTNRFGEEYARYFQTNSDSLKAFQQRKDEGMNLSSRVWNLSEQYKSELEESITAAIAPGMPAMELAAQVKQYLKEPNKRFRRIKEKMEDDTIKWRLSNPAKAYYPGQGVYRSSARNAQRLARTEINMAYRTAEQERWKQFDFVVGYEVKTTQNGHHVEDICDRLAGKYPKDFKFTGWHPQCMCYCIPILKTEDEFWDLDEDKPSVNEVRDVPGKFKEWIADNADRIGKAESGQGTLPYFIRDNKEVVDAVLRGESTETAVSNSGKAVSNPENGSIATEKAVSEMETKERERIEANRREYERLLADPDYTDVEFNPKDGGLKATHVEHEKHDKVDSKRLAFGTMTPNDLEKECQDILYDNGFSCILNSEHIFDPITGKQLKVLDTTTNGRCADIVSLTENGEKTIKNALDRKKKQIRKVNEIYGTEWDSVILHFHDPSFFNEEKVRKGLGKTFRQIICAVNSNPMKVIIIE